MALSNYIVKSDKFEAEDSEKSVGFAFPCNVCIHRHGTDKEEPCVSCGHNTSMIVNAIEDDESKYS